jgi:hypothetical protein
MDKQFKVVIEIDGKMEIAVEGMVGSQCVTETEFFEKELGKVVERKRTSDYYKPRQTVLRNKINIGNREAP